MLNQHFSRNIELDTDTRYDTDMDTSTTITIWKRWINWTQSHVSVLCRTLTSVEYQHAFHQKCWCYINSFTNITNFRELGACPPCFCFVNSIRSLVVPEYQVLNIVHICGATMMHLHVNFLKIWLRAWHYCTITCHSFNRWKECNVTKQGKEISSN